MEWLQYIIPPITGSIIGYFTNMLAIQMLFRPYTKWYLWKIPIPLTPGLIPKKRQDITTNMAKVGDRLFSDEENWKHRLSSPEIRNATQNFIRKFWDSTYTKEHPTLGELIPDKYEAELKKIVEFIEEKSVGYIKTYLAKPESEPLIHELIETGLAHLTEKELQELLSSEKRDTYFKKVYDAIIHSPRLSGILQELIQHSLFNIANSEKTLNDFISEEQRQILIASLAKNFPEMVETLVQQIASSDLRTTLITKITTIIHAFLDELGAIRKFVFNTVMQMRSTIDEKVPKMVDTFLQDIPEMLNQKENQQQIINILTKYVDNISQQPMYQLLSFLDKDTLETAINQVGKQFTHLLQSDNIKHAIHKGFNRFYEANKTETVRSLVGESEKDLRTELGNYLSEQVIQVLRSETFGKKVEGVIHERLHALVYSIPVGVLAERFPLTEERQDRFVHGVTDFILSQVQDYVIPVLKVLDIRQLLYDRMERFSIQQVEELILTVIKKHFKYINLIGGIIGFFIGCLQILLNQIFP